MGFTCTRCVKPIVGTIYRLRVEVKCGEDERQPIRVVRDLAFCSGCNAVLAKMESEEVVEMAIELMKTKQAQTPEPRDV